MKIEFDPKKDAANRVKHGLSLAFAAKVLSDPARLEILDVRFDYAKSDLSPMAACKGAFMFAYLPSAARSAALSA